MQALHMRLTGASRQALVLLGRARAIRQFPTSVGLLAAAVTVDE
jgi:hypothetical protein